MIAVKQRNLDQLDELFWAVSTPRNPRYRQHIKTLEEMAELVGPSHKTINQILNWLESNGATDAEVTPVREFIKVKVTPAIAAKLFHIDYHRYVHESGAVVDISVGPYSVPQDIAELVDVVGGVVGFPDLHKPIGVRRNQDPSPNQNMSITPMVIRTRYNVTTIGTNPKNSHAVAEFQGQYYSPSDLQQFWNSYVPFAPFEAVNKVIGVNVAGQPGIEASLDIQYLMGVAPNVTTYFYSMKNADFYSDLLVWIGEIAADPTAPWVHSVSYGSQGNYPSDTLEARLNTEIQKLGARGISIIFASGDSGSACQSNAYSGCDCSFFPSFPAICPYVTSVGATRFLNGNSGPEGAVFLFKSGGGFSIDPFNQGSYQASVVDNYLTNSGVTMPESCAYNASGRATPDVSALGDEYYQVIVGGQDTPVGGTSASTPSFSAVITLLNDLLLNNGQSTLGFLNPFIYFAAGQPGAFFDVTIGDNQVQGCCSNGISGFNCAVGWDPVTGVGTPNYAVLSRLVLSSELFAPQE